MAIAGVGLAGRNGRGRRQHAVRPGRRRCPARPWPRPACARRTSTDSARPVLARCHPSTSPSTWDCDPAGWTRPPWAAPPGRSWLRHAADAIAEGQADVVLLTYGSTARSDLRAGLAHRQPRLGITGPQQWEAPYGITLISKYAMAARRHMHEYGTTIEQLAEIAVSARYNAGFNPDAQARDPHHHRRRAREPDDRRSLHGPAVLPPLRWRSRRRAGGRGPPGGPPRHAGVGARQRASTSRMSRWANGTTSPPARRRCRAGLAFERAGVTPADIDVCQLYDAFTYMLLITLEDLGFCAKGEGGPFVAGRQAAPRWLLAHQHRRRRAELVPSGPARAVPARRSGAPAQGGGGGSARYRGRAGLRQRHGGVVLQQRHHDFGRRVTLPVTVRGPWRDGGPGPSLRISTDRRCRVFRHVRRRHGCGGAPVRRLARRTSTGTGG